MSIFVLHYRITPAAVFCLYLLGVVGAEVEFKEYTLESSPFSVSPLAHLSLLQAKVELFKAREASQSSEAVQELQASSSEASESSEAVQASQSSDGDAEQSPADLSQIMGGDIVSQLSDLVGDDATSRVKLTSTIVVKPGKNGTNQGEGQETQKTQIVRTLVVKQQQEVTPAPTEEQAQEEKVASIPRALASDVAKIASGINRTEFEDKTALKAPEPSPEDIRQMRALASMRVSATNMVMRLDSLVKDTELARNAFADDGSLKVEQVVPPLGSSRLTAQGAAQSQTSFTGSATPMISSSAPS